MPLEEIWLAPGFAREVLNVYEAWEGKDAVPMKFKELMLVLRIEVARRYDPNFGHRESKPSSTRELRQTKLRFLK